MIKPGLPARWVGHPAGVPDEILRHRFHTVSDSRIPGARRESAERRCFGAFRRRSHAERPGFRRVGLASFSRSFVPGAGNRLVQPANRLPIKQLMPY